MVGERCKTRSGVGLRGHGVFYGRIEESVSHGVKNLCGSIGGFYVPGTTLRD